MAPDLIIYAIVAAGLVIWLRNILGTRNGSERERPNPFTIQTDGTEAAERLYPGIDKAAGAEEKIAHLVANPNKVTSVESKTAENGLLEISRADRNFDINFFLESAQDAFVMIVEAFARGERDTLKNLLNDSVYASFEQTIKDRETRGEIMEAEILAVRRAMVTEAKTDARMAYVTVRFEADETTVTRDADGNITAGHPERIVPMRDIWVFGRDIRSRDPRWLLCETRSDSDGDNDLLPNTN